MLLSSNVSLLTTKLILTPLLVAVVTLAARRWGATVGGWIAGLPLNSAPISVFLALEQGRPFAASSARATLLGLVAVGTFCVAYARTTKRSWPTALVLGIGFCLLATGAMSLISAGLLVSTVITTVLLSVALILIGHPTSRPPVPPPWWDIPMRMVAATTLVLLITEGAHLLGPKWSGLFSTFPIFACVMAVSSHQQGSAADAHRLLRGVIIASYATAAFLIVVVLAVERTSLLLTYSLAVAVTLLVNGISLLVILRRQAAFHGQNTQAQ